MTQLVRFAPVAVLALATGVQAGEPAAENTDAGRYLVTIAGCHDCHTAGWTTTNGNIPESEWLTGVPLGWRGPWGTTYASNLRLLAADITEAGWVEMLKTRKDRPPMPWMNVNQMAEDDSRAIYRYIRALGAAGNRMPVGTAPGVEPDTAYLLLEPVEPARLKAVSANERSPQ